MIQFVFDQSSFFFNIIDSLLGLFDDITFTCSPKAIDLQALDISHVSLIYIYLPSEIFSQYECSQEMNLSFNIDVLNKVLKSASGDDVLTILSEDPNEDIEIQIATQNEDKNTTFHLKPVDIEQEGVTIPDQAYTAKLTMGSSEFNSLVRNLSEISDSVKVQCKEESISFSVNDSLLNATTTYKSGVIREKAEEEIEVNVTEACTVSYALRYLKAISGAAGLSARVGLSFSSTFPLLVEYTLNEDGFVRFYLAPKVDEEASDED